MKTLKQLIESKSKKLATVSPKDTVLHALEVMAQYDVGALIFLAFGVIFGFQYWRISRKLKGTDL